MKNLSAQAEAAILDQLDTDIAKDPKNAGTLNTLAIKKIYKAEACVRCGHVVSMLSEGLCGCCEHTGKDKAERWVVGFQLWYHGRKTEIETTAARYGLVRMTEAECRNHGEYEYAHYPTSIGAGMTYRYEDEEDD